jgi:hypothetical protein
MGPSSFVVKNVTYLRAVNIQFLYGVNLHLRSAEQGV